MPNQELITELSLAEEALRRALSALIEASNRYCATFPQSVKDGLPSYAESKSNVSAAYYMYATALSYVLTSAEKTLASLSPLAQKATEVQEVNVAERCADIIRAYEQFSADALSPYFEESQAILHASANSIALSPLYQATKKLSLRSEEFLKHLFS